MTAKLTDFAVIYKISESVNLTKACAYHRQNREIVRSNPNFHRPFHDIRKAAQKGCPSFHRSSIFPRRYRLSFNFRFVIKDKSVFAVLSWFHVFMRRSKGRTTPLNVLLQPKMLRPKYALIIRQSKPFVNWQFA